MATWNDRLRARREAANIPKGQFARLAKVSAPTVTDWESGKIKKIDGENLVKVCDVLGVSPKWLLTGREPRDYIDGEVIVSALPAPEAAPALSPRHQALIGLFDGLTDAQQEALIRDLQAKKSLNDELLGQLLARRQAQ